MSAGRSKRASTIVLAALGILLLSGCARSGRPEQQFPPVEGAQRVAVLEATGKLRDDFNSDAGCDAIYAFPSYPKERWLADCAQLHSDMGSWRSFRPRTIARCAMPETFICLDGDAAFTKGDRILELTWLLQDGRVRLVAIAWQDGRQWIRIPPSRDRQQDTPPVPEKSRTDKRG